MRGIGVVDADPMQNEAETKGGGPGGRAAMTNSEDTPVHANGGRNSSVVKYIIFQAD